MLSTFTGDSSRGESRSERTPWRYRLGLYRCWICQRPRALHTPAQRRRCEDTPLPIVLTAKGLAAYQAMTPTTATTDTDSPTAA